ncbi:MAG: P-loop NTPase fold protein [Verrucomicrobiota bacterium]
MWSDNETTQDFLNFRTVADTAGEMILRAGGKPLSIGISGGWGVGKSSMVRLMQQSLASKFPDKFIFVEFNAWLYQGYDDVKAALMEVIAKVLLEHSEKTRKGTENVKEFLNRVDWVRAIGFAGSIAATIAGFPPIGLVKSAVQAISDIASGDVSETAVEGAIKTGEGVTKATGGLLRVKASPTPPRAIQELRDYFAKALQEMEVTLVVFVDDLDRCLPETAISTLEAMRLFLFLQNTAFVIAADESMIRFAVRAHFKNATLDEELVTNYFDKLIQVPLRVPPLGTQEVRAYLFLLYLENDNTITSGRKEEVRKAVCNQLAESWQNKRVDKTFILDQLPEASPTLKNQLDLADRIAPLLTTSTQVAGNPRLIKRFLNTIAIRLSTAHSQGVLVDEAALTKLLILERCGHKDAYKNVLRAALEDDGGKAAFLKPWEDKARKSEEITDLPTEWNSPFTIGWFRLDPALSGLDLRAAFYVSRDYMPIIHSEKSLSKEGSEVLAALLAVRTSVPAALSAKLNTLSSNEKLLIQSKLLIQARQPQKWGTPGILHAMIAVATGDEASSEALKTFLQQIPTTQLEADIVPLLRDKPFSGSVFEAWKKVQTLPKAVRNAIDLSKT